DMMKRFFAFSLLLAMGFGIVAFQCSSTELTSAKLYMQQKQYDKAKEALQREIEKNPKSDEGYYLLGLLHGEEGHIDLMMDAYNKSLGISNKFEKNIKDNRQYYWASSFNKGVSYFNKAAKTQNSLIGMIVDSVTACLGSPDRTMDSEYANFGSTSMYVYEKYGIYIYMKEDKVVAYNLFDNKEQKVTKLPECTGSDLQYLNAVSAFSDAILCEPDSVDSYTNLAFVFVNMNKSERALPALEKQTELYKKKLNVTTETGQLSGAQYASLLDSYALQGEILTKLGAATEDKDKKNEYYNKAIEKMQEAKKYFPDDPSILLHLSNAYIATDRLDIAMDSFNEGVEKDPENKYYRFNYGSMLLNANEFEKAAEQLQKAVDIDPE
ncbi:MAG: tetratricopeptide repeat protein, partial [Melioribacteraceae bacterium]